MQKRMVVAAVLLALCVSRAEAGRRRAVQPGGLEERTYADVALRAAAWLGAIAQPGGERMSWPTDPAAGGTAAGLHGTAGVGMFHLRLYQVTRDGRHLDTARRAASFVATQNFGPNGFEWQSGAVGCGSFLLALYRETGEPEQLRRAQRIADWLLSQGIADPDGGLHWAAPSQAPRVFTGMAHGAAGVAMLLLQLHELSPDARYLAAAEAALRWMARYTMPIAEHAIGWKRLTTDHHVHHGWCGGSSGIVFVLAKAYQLTGNDAYRSLLVKTADGLALSGRTERAGLSWSVGSHEQLAYHVYCHGSGSVIGALSVAYEVTGDARYLEVANAAVDYLADVAERHGDGLNWPHNTAGVSRYGFSIGTASIGHAFLRLYRHTRDPRLLELARQTAAFLVSRADVPREGEVRWPVVVDPVPPAYASEQGFKTGWFDGTAGVGMFLLELHDYVNRRQPPAEFSPANP